MSCRGLLTSYFLSPRQQRPLTCWPDSCRHSWALLRSFSKKEGGSFTRSVHGKIHHVGGLTQSLINPEWDQISSITVKCALMYLNYLLSTFFQLFFFWSQVRSVTGAPEDGSLSTASVLLHSCWKPLTHWLSVLLIMLAASPYNEVWRRQKQHFSEQVNAEPPNISVGNELHAFDEEGSQLYSSRKNNIQNCLTGTCRIPAARVRSLVSGRNPIYHNYMDSCLYWSRVNQAGLTVSCRSSWASSRHQLRDVCSALAPRCAAQHACHGDVSLYRLSPVWFTWNLTKRQRRWTFSDFQ